MTDIFYLEKEHFLRLMFERVSKMHSVNLYTHDSVKELEFLVDDLTPKVIVLDQVTLGDSLEILIAKYENKIKIIVTTYSEREASNFKARGLLVESKPLSVASFERMIAHV